MDIGSYPEVNRRSNTPNILTRHLLGNTEDRLATAHFHHLAPCETFTYPESAGDVHRATQNRVMEAELNMYSGIYTHLAWCLVSRFGRVSSLPYLGFAHLLLYHCSYGSGSVRASI